MTLDGTLLRIDRVAMASAVDQDSELVLGGTVQVTVKARV